MRRLLRWCFNGLCLLSLLACLGVGAAWARGYWVATYGVLTLNQPPAAGALRSDSHALYVGAGGLFYQHEESLVLDPARWPQYSVPREFVWLPSDGPHYPHSEPLTPSPLNRVGIEWSADRWATDSWKVHHFSVTLPCWLLALPAAIPPALWARGWRKRRLARRRASRGLCPACGYDCRVTPDRCPECGAVPTAPR